MQWPASLPRILWVQRKCPACAATRFNTGGRPFTEKMLHTFGLRRVRCAACSRQYYWFIGRERCNE
jgi:hypothetical protein